ncbi:MAG: hypothetical protein JSR59_04160 [Proteobacteria bacterium]|nr:hypothetical protein [Pseudomonadota bacterium]
MHGRRAPARPTFVSHGLALARERAGEWRSVCHVMRLAGPLHSATRLGGLAVAALRLAWSDANALAALGWQDIAALLRRR